MLWYELHILYEWIMFSLILLYDEFHTSFACYMMNCTYSYWVYYDDEWIVFPLLYYEFHTSLHAIWWIAHIIIANIMMMLISCFVEYYYMSDSWFTWIIWHELSILLWVSIQLILCDWCGKAKGWLLLNDWWVYIFDEYIWFIEWLMSIYLWWVEMIYECIFNECDWLNLFW